MEPVVLEHLHRHPADRGLVVVRSAVVEVDDRSLGGRADVLTRPALEGVAGEVGQGGLPVDAERPLDDPAKRPVP